MSPSQTGAPARAAYAPTRLFLTGGGGYVGRNLIRHFTARGVDVVALARSDTAAEMVRSLGARVVRGALLDANLTEAMAGCDALVHAAADLDHGHGGARQARTNVEGTRSLLQAAKTAGVARAVHLSTESVLLDGRPLRDADEEHPFPRHPAGRYSATKGEAERLALAMTSSGFEVIAVRPRLVWGRDDTTAAPQLMAAVNSGQFAWIDGGGYRTSTTHIANLCNGVDRALAQGRGGQAYFITDGESVVFRDFITALLSAHGVVAPDKTVPLALLRIIAAIGDSLARATGGAVHGPVSRQVLATSAVEVTLRIDKARRELGYRPTMSREAGLAEIRAARPITRG